MSRPRFVLEDVLAPFRAIERLDDAVILIGDDDAFKVLIAWRNTDQSWSRPRGAVPVAMHGKLGALWAWIVKGWEIDEGRVAELAGVSVARTHEKLAMLIGNRFIYPDGSTAKATDAALMSHTATKIGVKAPKTRATPRATKHDDNAN